MRSQRFRVISPLGWSVLALILGIALCNPLPVRATGDEPRAEFPPVPADAIGVAHIRLAAVWTSEPVVEIRKALLRAGPEALEAIDRRFAPAPSTIDRLTVVVSAPEGLAREPVFCAYLQTNKAFDAARVLKCLLPMGERQHAGGVDYYLDAKSGLALRIADDRTILFGRPESVRALLEKAPKPGGPLRDVLKLAHPKTPIVFAINVAALPVPPGSVPPQFSPLLDSKLLTATIELDPALRLNLNWQFASPEKATAGAKAIRAGLAMARQLLATARAPMEAMIRGKEQSDPSPISELPEALGGVWGLGMVQVWDDLLKNFPLEQRESTLHASLSLGTGSSPFSPAASGAAIALLLPAVQRVRTSANRVQDANNLRQIALAMHNYNAEYGRFPPAAICSKDGKPLLSWRVAILPYLGQQNLYQQFKLDEPWDSEHNKKLLSLMPKVYVLPEGAAAGAFTTHYRVFVGPEAGFPLRKGRRIAEITDGTANTWMVVEAREAVPWTKPDDLVFQPNKPLPLLGNYFNGGFNAAFMDASVRFYQQPPPEKTIRALITPAGGEVIRPED
jgi:hypothetical protein